MDLRLLLPRLMPGAIAWAEALAAEVASEGHALDASGLSDARTVGVRKAEDIRVLMVDRLPLPSDSDLRTAALHAGLLGPTMTGLTLGHSILICHGHLCRRLLSHECRHVFQYEQAGSIAAFLPRYLQSIVEVGYCQSPFEQDARNHELA